MLKSHPFRGLQASVLAKQQQSAALLPAMAEHIVQGRCAKFFGFQQTLSHSPSPCLPLMTFYTPSTPWWWDDWNIIRLKCSNQRGCTFIGTLISTRWLPRWHSLPLLSPVMGIVGSRSFDRQNKHEKTTVAHARPNPLLPERETATT